MDPSRRTMLAATAAGLLAAPRIALGQAALTPIKFSLDWAFQGPQAPFLLAGEMGFFRDEGLDVTMDRGFGSGDVPVKVASGAYQFGVGDVTGMIRAIIRGHAAAHRDPDAAIAALVKRDPTAPQDLEKARMLANDEFIRVPDVLSGGYGDVPLDRVQSSIETIRAAFGIANTLAAADVYLPPADDLKVAS